MPDEKPKPKIGRPSKFESVDLKWVEKLAEAGLTDEQLAVALSVDGATIYRWKLNEPTFCEALKPKLLPDGTIKRSLYERARGYYHPSEEIHVDKFGHVTRVPITKHYPPDPTSMIFWLKNRMPKEFRERVEHDHTGTVNQVVRYHKADRRAKK